jgi:hypothetical protein
MTLTNSLLLQIGQKKSSYNDLLTKILSNYSSKNSAKAALSRALKNMTSFEYITKEEGFYKLTNKGRDLVQSKLKNKMFININKITKKVRQTYNFDLLDEMIKNIQIFLERSKQDQALLKAGKTSFSFYISDLEDILEKLNNKISHLNYLSKNFEKQILIFQERNFDNLKVLKLDRRGFHNLKNLLDFYDLDEILIETENKDLIKLLETNYIFKKKTENIFRLDTKFIKEFISFIFENIEIVIQSKLKIYVNEVLITIKENHMYFVGPHNIIVNIK